MPHNQTIEKPPQEIPDKKEKKVFKAVLVDTTDVMKSQARDVADEKMTMEPPKNPEDLKGFKKFFKTECTIGTISIQ